jgi:DNA polymerase I-like protein with 3'-5' exonuclease and polymerase domains
MGSLQTGRMFPIYRCLGTVSGRITIDSPNLQHLRRTNRDVFSAEAGNTLIYPDYSQFEPGILADDSEDKYLTRDYNSGDLYVSLSKKVFGSESDRDSAKILFLAFCYGMKPAALSRLAAENTGRPMQEMRRILNSFFGRYKRLYSWAAELRDELVLHGRIRTRLGNSRLRTHVSGRLSQDEARWVISQRIQGTAAMLLKRVIIEIHKKHNNVGILLPMHDALLLQVPRADAEKKKQQIRRIFINTFKEECPEIEPRVSFKLFSESEPPAVQ